MRRKQSLMKKLLISGLALSLIYGVQTTGISNNLLVINAHESSETEETSTRSRQTDESQENNKEDSFVSNEVTDLQLLKEEELSEEIEELVAFFEDIINGQAIVLDDFLEGFSDLEQSRQDLQGFFIIDFVIEPNFRGQVQFDGESEQLQNYYFHYLTGHPREIDAAVMEEARNLLENESEDITMDWLPNAYIISPSLQERNFIASDETRALNVIRFTDNNQLYRVILYNYENQPVDESLAESITAAVITGTLNNFEDYTRLFGPPFYHIYDTELNTSFMTWLNEAEEDYLIVEMNHDTGVVHYYSPAFEE